MPCTSPTGYGAGSIQAREEIFEQYKNKDLQNINKTSVSVWKWVVDIN